ncbi:MAG: DNA mismatch repair protein MutT [Betaproteobacteria bacterium RIFCSPLOWO2_12_FULL_62_13b]|nr:MAG: DNA mismatch repair protein MutT [Betaproteobacteria bacterium RIFCSPLOWO2_12_FULL_62_13b]
MNTTPVEVVAAVIERPDGTFLLAQRPAGKVYAGYWEFPGGKVEPGEPLAAALARELHEELGIDVESARPWIVQTYAYPHAIVRLNFFRVRAWKGDPHGKEDQRLAWQHVSTLAVAPLLPANAPVLRALELPFEYAITHAGEIGTAEQLRRIDERLAQGLRLIQVREKSMRAPAVEHFAQSVLARARPHGAIVLINSDIELALRLGADGVHLTAAQLAVLERRPALGWCAASCHNAEELVRAAELGVDFAVLGPVQATPTHPDSMPLGWEGFAALARGASLPVFALGGMKPDDLETAWRCGAQGIAMVRGSWQGGDEA